MGRAATATNSAATTVEQQQVNSGRLAHPHQLFLGAVLGPGSSGSTGVLGRVGVANHYFLRPGQAVAVVLKTEQFFDYRSRAIQIVQGFKQWCHAHGAAHPSFLEQQLHGQHIGRAGGHGDHVGAHGSSGRTGNYLAGFQHFPGVITGHKVAAEQRPAVVEFG